MFIEHHTRKLSSPRPLTRRMLRLYACLKTARAPQIMLNRMLTPCSAHTAPTANSSAAGTLGLEGWLIIERTGATCMMRVIGLR